MFMSLKVVHNIINNILHLYVVLFLFLNNIYWRFVVSYQHKQYENDTNAKQMKALKLRKQNKS